MKITFENALKKLPSLCTGYVVVGGLRVVGSYRKVRNIFNKIQRWFRPNPL